MKRIVLGSVASVFVIGNALAQQATRNGHEGHGYEDDDAKPQRSPVH